MKYVWNIGLCIFLSLVAVVIWTRYGETNITAKSTQMTNAITIETYKVSYEDKNLYGVITAPKDYRPMALMRL